MANNDAYLNYTQRFFERWVGLYDYFAASIFYAYRQAVRSVSPHQGLRILDVCTGTAEIAHRCARRGAWVCGVDITEAMLRRAAKKMRQQPVSFFRMDARMLAFKDESFDVAVVSFALHDMPRRVRVEVLREARRVSKCVVVLDYDFPTHRFARVCWIWLISLFESPYFPSFANEDMRNLFKEAGISILERQHAFPYLFSVYVLGSSQHQPEK